MRFTPLEDRMFQKSNKRQKELARIERRKEKDDRRAQRRKQWQSRTH